MARTKREIDVDETMANDDGFGSEVASITMEVNAFFWVSHIKNN